MKFALKGFKDRTIGCSNSQTPLEIKGQWLTQGRQPICNDGCPQWIADIFDGNPDLEVIAIGTKSHGTVYSR